MKTSISIVLLSSSLLMACEQNYNLEMSGNNSTSSNKNSAVKLPGDQIDPETGLPFRSTRSHTSSENIRSSGGAIHSIINGSENSSTQALGGAIHSITNGSENSSAQASGGAIHSITNGSENSSTQASGGAIHSITNGSENSSGQVSSAIKCQNTIKICTAEELRRIRLAPEGSYELICDIDMMKEEWQPFHFSGCLNGQNHSIRNLQLNSAGEQGVGLFSNISHAKLTKLNILQAFVQAKASAGILAGSISYSDLEYIRVEGSVRLAVPSDAFHAGGIAAVFTHSKIRQSSANVEVKGTYNIGGLFGNAFNSIITESFACSELTGSNANGAGGLIGSAQNITLERSYAKSTILRGSRIGGIIGILSFQNSLMDSFAEGKIEASNNDIGGAMGLVGGGTEMPGTTMTLERVYSRMTGPGAGRFHGIGKLSKSPVTVHILNSYFDQNRAGPVLFENEFGAGITSEDISQISSYEGWNFDNVWILSTNSSGEIRPVLRALPPEPCDP